MKYALNLSEDNRILSACKVLKNGKYEDMSMVDTLPEGNIADYLYIDNEYIHDPLPMVEVEETPSQLDRVESQVAYLAMMTGYTEILEV